MSLEQSNLVRIITYEKERRWK